MTGESGRGRRDFALYIKEELNIETSEVVAFSGRRSCGLDTTADLESEESAYEWHHDLLHQPAFFLHGVGASVSATLLECFAYICSMFTLWKSMLLHFLE